MKKQKAGKSWTMLIASLPKGIASFVVALTGLCLSLPLSVIVIGLPLLSRTMVLCRRMMEDEAGRAKSWLSGAETPSAAGEANAAGGIDEGRRSMLAPLKNGRSYRGLIFAFMQLPVGIAAFTCAIVLPVTAFAVLLSPLAYEVSMRMFDFNLFSEDWALDRLFDGVSSVHRSWVAGGVGLVFVLLQPALLKLLGRWYASWILYVAGPEPEQPQATEGQYAFDELSPIAAEARETRLHA